MIISHKYQFIFIKTTKTAGTSIEIALSKFCGSEDIITPIYPEEEMRKQLGYRGAQNYQSNGFYNHIHAAEIKKLIGDEVWNSYYKFCFERNPWDRFVSYYYWRYQLEPRPTIAEFVESEFKPLFYLRRMGFKLYTIEGEVAVDRVCLYENLNEELEQLRIRLGLPETLQLPRAKASTRKDQRSYREILDENTQKQIQETFSKEISMFGYAL
ncbi:MAG: sulfotransferase family 2 domain-containing protein [Moorea sp. SIO2B7]|nr:sulfotransferase family 2 domain-containing protein [Moorena sp. SIO2B7]